MKARLKRSKFRTLLGKLLIFVFILTVGLLVLNWFLFAPHPSPISDIGVITRISFKNFLLTALKLSS